MSVHFHTSARAGLAHILRSRLRLLRYSFRASITARVIALTVVAGVLLLGVVGVSVYSQMTSSIFNRAVSVYLDRFETARSRAQAQIDAANAPTASELQRIANEIVANQGISGESVEGVVLLRSEVQPSGASFEITEPSTQSTARIRSVVTAEMREAVADNAQVHWQSVELLGGQRNAVPGLLYGARLVLPGAGQYELYIAYSLESEEYTLSAIGSIAVLGAGILLLFIAIVVALVLRMVVRPVREASRNATMLSEGGFDARMEVTGEDELAQMARSFNQMASSLEEQFTQLERISKVQQEFVSAVSHELRSPVTTIRMAGQLIYDKRDELPPVLRRSAELQHDQLINLDVMLSDLLEISRYDAGAMTLASEKADIAAIVEEAVEAQVPLAESNGVEVVMETRGDTTAKIEPRRVQRIVRNLVVNALEHAEGHPIRVLTVGTDDAVAVEVSDRGVGLSDEQAAHVFDRFWRADSSRVRKSGGTGLGLTIAREDAMLHGGRLQCAGELGVGSTFLLTLPKVVGELVSAPLELRVAAKEESWGELVVDGQEKLGGDGEQADVSTEEGSHGS